MRALSTVHDTLLQEQTQELFSLDPLSWDILNEIARNGPQNAYQLNLGIPRGGINPIRTRIKGSSRFVGLEKEWFISIDRTETFRESEPRHARYYSLLFKGFLASLADVRLEENTLFRGFLDYLNTRLPTETSEDIIIYIKCELASWLQSHIENRFQLTHLKNALRYYLLTKDTDRHFGRQEDSSAPVVTDSSIDRSALALEVEDYRTIYSERWVRVTNRKRDLEAYLYETSDASPEGLNGFFRYWPISFNS